MLAVAVVGGSVNGLAVAYLKMIPFVVTLSTMAIFGGASVWITNAVSVTGIPRSFITTVMADIGIFPIPVLGFVVATIIVQLFLTRSLYGRWLYAVGTNIRAARVSGVPTQRVLFGAYAFSGFIAGLAAIVTTAWLGTAGGPSAPKVWSSTSSARPCSAGSAFTVVQVPRWERSLAPFSSSSSATA